MKRSSLIHTLFAIPPLIGAPGRQTRVVNLNTWRPAGKKYFGYLIAVRGRKGEQSGATDQRTPVYVRHLSIATCCTCNDEKYTVLKAWQNIACFCLANKTQKSQQTLVVPHKLP